MSVEFHKRVRELFDQAMERPEAERLAFLQAGCGGDPNLFDSVERLLTAQHSSAQFMETTAQAAKRIGRYIIREELGRGAMGVVYDGLDPLIGRSVAVKVIHLREFAEPREAEFLTERLFREARSAGQLFHPGIVIILDVGKEGDTAFIAMEKVEGQSLQQLLAPGQLLGTAEVLSILQQTAAALDYAHERGVVHRDIKPANIMLHHGSLVKVADFGIAKVMSQHNSTVAGVVMGTPSYMSPEQVMAQSVDGRSDQFSLAVLAFELLTGAKPFQGDSLPALAHTIVYGDRPSASSLNPALPVSVDDVLRRGLGKLPGDRYPTCAQFVAGLDAALNRTGPVVHPIAGADLPPHAPPQFSSTGQIEKPTVIQPPMEQETVKKKGSNAVVYAALVVVLAAAIVAGFMYYRFGGARPAPAASPAAAIRTEAPVTPVSQPVIRFSADPVAIDAGASAKLSWDVTGANEIEIDNGVGKVGGTGIFVVAPSQSTTYVLTATGSGSGSSARAAVSVEVRAKAAPPPPLISKEVTPPASAPAASPVGGSAHARQLYEAAVEKRRSGLPGAVDLLRQAATLGDPRAMLDLGEAYRDGDGIGKDEKEAVLWFRKAADAGNSSGMVLLGASYLMGDGVGASDEEAVKWFQKAANAKNAAGLYDLATMYEGGRGVPLSLEKAKDLYRKSAELGNSEAQRRLAALK
jgi:TPR repeat protein/tRNA A-37 threonylcarbamoyl transferase component Bud32